MSRTPVTSDTLSDETRAAVLALEDAAFAVLQASVRNKDLSGEYAVALQNTHKSIESFVKFVISEGQST